MSVTEAAEAVGLHPSTTRLHLDLLVSAGLVDRAAERRPTAGRPAIRYSAHPGVPTRTATGGRADDEATRDDYRRLATVLAVGLEASADPSGAAVEAGRRWTAALDVTAPPSALGPEAVVGQVVELMERLGFSPEPPGDADRIELRRCPFETVARAHRGVVCGVHQGMLEETFHRLGGSVEVAALEPFVVEEPLRCVVALRRVPAGEAVVAPGPATDDHGAGGRSRRRPAGRPLGGVTRG